MSKIYDEALKLQNNPVYFPNVDGTQCVALVMSVVKTVTGVTFWGNGADMANSANQNRLLAAGIKFQYINDSASLQPGDIVAMSGGTNGWGHTAFYAGNGSWIQQNYAKHSYVTLDSVSWDNFRIYSGVYFNGAIRILDGTNITITKTMEELVNMKFKYTIKGGGPTYWYDGTKSVILTNPDQLGILDSVATAATGKPLPYYTFESKGWHDRFLQATGQKSMMTADPNQWITV